ncbi:Uncharacterized protein PBTT_05847 [Plasmodiophora brassicae]|uniref:Uncharacterized protein n=1 Tax=Plasmodiophora brassicae TaxID=37360 RepID=A0A0G4J305_PLABS|nr:hypothetical protein PBRA_002298 [Plasmodiophora brassicae]SPQ98885.1 unnamed protein product [Plasmodiophora brassicae]
MTPIDRRRLPSMALLLLFAVVFAGLEGVASTEGTFRSIRSRIEGLRAVLQKENVPASAGLPLLESLADVVEQLGQEVTGLHRDGDERMQEIEQLRRDVNDKDAEIVRLQSNITAEQGTAAKYKQLGGELATAKKRIDDLVDSETGKSLMIASLESALESNSNRSKATEAALRTQLKRRQGRTDVWKLMTGVVAGAVVGAVATSAGVPRPKPTPDPVPEKAEGILASLTKTTASLAIGGGIGALAVQRLAKAGRNGIAHVDDNIPKRGAKRDSPSATSRVAVILPWVLLALVVVAGAAVAVTRRLKARARASNWMFRSGRLSAAEVAARRPSHINY